MQRAVRAVLAASVSVAGAEAAESSFSKLDLETCSTVLEDQGGVVLRCEGLNGIPVLYKEGDLRPSLFYGTLEQKTEDSGFETFSTFSSVNQTIEWRSDGGRPYATILRFFISNADPETGSPSERLKGQVLVVSKVGSQDDPSACVVGLVDALANKHANELAQQVADTKARDFSCGRDTAVFEGNQGPLASTFNSNLGGFGDQP